MKLKHGKRSLEEFEIANEEDGLVVERLNNHKIAAEK